jgi:hypothetical protein
MNRHDPARCAPLLPLLALFLSNSPALQAVSITSAGPTVSTTISLNYVHLVNNCAGSFGGQGPCTETVTPNTGPFNGIFNPTVTLAPLVPNAIISSALLYLQPLSTLSNTDVQNSWSSSGTVSGSTNNPQGQNFPLYRISDFSFNGFSFSPNTSAVDLLALGLGPELINGGTFTSTGAAAISIFAYDGWTGTSNFSYTQNRTITRVQNFDLRVNIVYTDPGPQVPEPHTLVSAAAALAWIGWKRRRRL